MQEAMEREMILCTKTSTSIATPLAAAAEGGVLTSQG